MNLNLCREGLLLLYKNPNLYEVGEHTIPKVEVNTRMLSTLRKGNIFEA